MNIENATDLESNDACDGDDFPGLYAGIPAEIRDGLTDHFLAMMGAEPLQAHERLAA